MKKISIFLVLCMLVCLLGAVVMTADVGNSEWDAGGGDYGDGDGSGLFAVVFLLLESGPIGWVILIALVVGVVLMGAKNKKNSAQMPPQQRVMQRNYTAMENSTVAAVRANDEAFSPEEFKAYAKDVFIRTQESWEAREFNNLRPYVTASYLGTLNAQAQEYVNGRKTNHMDGQSVSEVWLTGYAQDGKNDVLTVRVTASLLDYTTNDDTGAVMSGSDIARVTRYYKLEFVRTAGLKTHADEKKTGYTCPNCGAPLADTGAGKCEYCGSFIIAGEHDWMLNGYSLWRDFN